MGDLELYFKVIEDNKGKSLLSQYLHTYNLTRQEKIITFVITNLHTYNLHYFHINISVIHMMKLKVKFNDGWLCPICQGHRGW